MYLLSNAEFAPLSYQKQYAKYDLESLSQASRREISFYQDCQARIEAALLLRSTICQPMYRASYVSKQLSVLNIEWTHQEILFSKIRMAKGLVGSYNNLHEVFCSNSRIIILNLFKATQASRTVEVSSFSIRPNTIGAFSLFYTLMLRPLQLPRRPRLAWLTCQWTGWPWAASVKWKMAHSLCSSCFKEIIFSMLWWITMLFRSLT